MRPEKEKILNYMSEKSYRPLKTRELAKGMGVKDTEYGTFRRIIKELIREGEIVKLKKNRLGLPDKLNLAVGCLSANKKGFGFVRTEQDENIYISPEDMGTSLHGDKVVVRLYSRKSGENKEGSVIKVLERGHKELVGTYKKSRHFAYVEPDDPRFLKDIYIANEDSLGAKPEEKVVVLLGEWRDPHLGPEGEIVEILGYSDDPETQILALMREFGLLDSFPEDVEKETEKIPEEIETKELKKRLDLRDKRAFTIDPFDAKDHDDAVSIEKTKDGNFILGVHIADVSFYVKENSSLDREALERGTSVYLADRVIPMLPEKLSNNICSLRPREDRFTLSLLMEISSKGKVLNYQIAESVIQSKAKLNYEEVQRFFDTGKRSPHLSGLHNDLGTMLSLSRILYKKRMNLGSLDFDLPEAKVLMGENGEVIDILEVARLESHRLIEEFMLLANKTIARYLTQLGIPFLYRVHDQPDQEKIEAFRDFVSHLGFECKFGKDVRPKDLQVFLKSVQGEPQENLVNELLLRSLKKACYQPKNIGHFGLAFKHYTHFTSPIRRYPDLLTHRILKETIQHKLSVEKMQKLKNRLPKIGEITSESEKSANEAEWESIKIKQLEFMEDKLGEVYSGLISGITNFGFWVKLEHTLTEGLVRLSSIGDDYYLYDPVREQLKGRHNKRTFRLGDKAKVQVARVDKKLKQIDFILFSEGKITKKKRK
jgi:ribonuclease R